MFSRLLVNKLHPHVRPFFTSSTRNSEVKRGIIHLAFSKYLLTTNIVSSGVLMAVGDIIQQEIEYQRNMLPQRYDLLRLTRMTIVGLLFGPLHHYFYGWLNTRLPNRDAMSITKKILFDQIIMSPVCILAFFYGMGFMERKKVEDINTETTGKFVEVYVMDWSVWPPTQFINFYFVPAKYQVFYINAVTMLYNVFLSYIKHREVAQHYSSELKSVSFKR